MARAISRLLVAMVTGLTLSLLLIMLIIWLIDPDFELVYNTFRLTRIVVDLLADLVGWVADQLATLL